MERFTGDDPGALARSLGAFELAGSVHRASPTGYDWTEFNVDLLRPLFALGEGTARTYIGAGAMVGRASFDEAGTDTQVGLNVLGGIRFQRRAFAPFAEARGDLGGLDQLSIAVGVQLFGGGF
ncbi:MAG: hypothetical protein EA352_12040 [Gemmatimonadales bacterium]|nr:MAG: hypothetical protein EA352_12040 [Gemmatimonadales bacterium]